MINKYIKRIFIIIKVSYYLKSLKNEGNNRDTIVMNTIRMIPGSFLVERVQSFLIALRGNTVYQLLDDGILEHWDSIQDTDNVKYLTPFQSSALYKMSNMFWNWLIIFTINHRNLHTIYVRDLLKDANQVMDYTKEFNESVENNIYSSCRRFSTSRAFWDNLQGQDYYKKTKINAKIMCKIAPELARITKPDRIISSHGVYTTWGIVHDYFVSKNIDTIVTCKAWYNKDSIYIVKNAIQKLYLEYSYNDQKNNWSKDKMEVIERYFSNRMSMKSYDNREYFNSSALSNALIKRNSSKFFTFGIFPNVIWDGAIKERNIIFDDIVLWVEGVISFFYGRDDALIIRLHPSETTILSGSVSFESIIRESFPDIDLCGNITIISSDSNVNTYALIENEIDIVLDYDTIVALEAVYLSTPVITASMSRYRKANFAITTSSKKEYYDLLKNPSDIIKKNDENKDAILLNMYQYAYWYIYLLNGYFPIDPLFDLERSSDKLTKNNFDERVNQELRMSLDRMLQLS
jgi:hypothetical protein